jgi:uncharacterized membrane protein YraQ (UPF0718 family)
MREKRGFGGWSFFAVACAAYGATFIIAPSLARQALASFLPMLASLGTVLVLVFLLMFLLDLFLTGERIESWLGSGAGMRGWILAAVAGVLSTGPIYPWYGILAELRRKGMRTALVAVFLYARAIKLPLFPAMAHYFGLRYTVVLSLFIAGFSILSGLAMERLARFKETRNYDVML